MKTDLIKYDKALKILLKGQKPLGKEIVGLTDLVGRTCAETVTAPRSQPPYAASAMDGFAVRSVDLDSLPARLKIVGESPAGRDFSGVIKREETVQVFTGGAIPEGADRVIIQENAKKLDRILLVREPQQGSPNIRAAGADFTKGQVLIERGKRLGPLDAAIVASADREFIKTYRRPMVTVFATGDELVEPGNGARDDQIINSNVFAVMALGERFGGACSYGGILPDNRRDVNHALQSAIDSADVIVTIGGASVGKYDIIREVAHSLGGQSQFEKVAIKPGKPTWHTRFETGSVLLGLPGNPGSALVCAHLFLGPLLRALSGSAIKNPAFSSAIAGHDLGPGHDRETFLIGEGMVENGQYRVNAFETQDSSRVSPFIAGNVLIRRPIGADPVEADATVEIVSLER